MSDAAGAGAKTTNTDRTSMGPVGKFTFGHSSLISKMPIAIGFIVSLALLGVRYLLAEPFFKSGLTKWEGFFKISGGASYLFSPGCDFAECYKLRLFGEAYNFPFPNIAVHMAGVAEIMLPILVMTGFLTRFAALGLLGMTVVIQIVFFDGWPTHIFWAGYALILIVLGPGLISLDEGWRRLKARSR